MAEAWKLFCEETRKHLLLLHKMITTVAQHTDSQNFTFHKWKHIFVSVFNLGSLYLAELAMQKTQKQT